MGSTGVYIGRGQELTTLGTLVEAKNNEPNGRTPLENKTQKIDEYSCRAFVAPVAATAAYSFDSRSIFLWAFV